MMEVPVVVHPRVSARHSEIEEEDAIHAWVYAVECAERVDSRTGPHTLRWDTTGTGGCSNSLPRSRKTAAFSSITR